MADVVSRLVAIDVKPGSLSDSLSGLNILHPKVYGRLEEEGCGKDVAFIVIHPSSNFHGHYLLEPLRRRGRAIMALNTRFAGNDVTLVMERCIQDLGAGVRFLRERGYRRVVLIGNSGGGSLSTFYQSQAEKLTITDAPDGTPIRLMSADLPPVDAIVLAAAHPSRAHTLTDWLDPAVIDERDPWAADPLLDMFNPANGPPYGADWLATYRAAQLARNRRITAHAQAMIRAFDADPDPERSKDGVFTVYRTAADPRFVDLALDPSDRVAGAPRGTARFSNFGVLGLARLCSYRSWLSQWSVDCTRAHGPSCLAHTSVPILAVDYSADAIIFPSQFAQWKAAAGDRCTEYVLKGATHHLENQSDLAETLADVLTEWVSGLH